jgi:hypothetical protein
VNRRGRTVDIPPGGPTTNGLYYDDNASLLSLTLTANF